MKIQLWLQGYVTDDISYLNGEKIDASMANLDEEHRVKFVTDLAAVSRGNSESINPAKRYKSLLSEAAPIEVQDNNTWEVLDNDVWKKI